MWIDAHPVNCHGNYFPFIVDVAPASYFNPNALGKRVADLGMVKCGELRLNSPSRSYLPSFGWGGDQ